MLYGFTVDDVGLDDYSTPEHVRNLVELADELGVKSTFFVVPRDSSGVTFEHRHEYLAILKDAVANGHEVGQHGIEHDRFEIGVPPQMILNLPHEGPSREFLRRNRDKLALEHSLENIRRKLREGRNILENAFGFPIRCFRSPALQVCDNLFAALTAEQYIDSSSCLQETGWDFMNGNFAAAPRPITRERFDALQRPGLPEFPLTTDYTWYLPREHYNAFMALAMHDFHGAVEAGIPLVSVSHVSPVQMPGDCGFEFLREWITAMKRECAEKGIPFTPMNLQQIAEVWKNA